MAGKKIQPIESLGNMDKLVVQKSQPLYALWQSQLTLAEFKILDTYLSRIDSHKPERKVVHFTKSELEKLFGVTRLNSAELEPRLVHLMSNVVKIPDPDDKRGFRLLTLFEEAAVTLDDRGQWQITLECTQNAMRYIFNIENLGYLKYRLHCVTSLTSRYSYIMFLYLEANKFRGSWNIQLDALKDLLCCSQEETYKQYKRLNDLILKKVYNELHEKTECRYSYTPIKQGRTVIGLHFQMERMDVIEEDSGQSATFVSEKSKTEEEKQDDELWVSALNPDGVREFDYAQIAVIREFLVCVPDTKLPKELPVYGDIELGRYHYMSQKMALLNQADARYAARGEKLGNRFQYLLKMIKRDAGLEA